MIQPLSTVEYFEKSPSIQFSITQNISERPYLFGFNMLKNEQDNVDQSFLISAPLDIEEIKINMTTTIRSMIGAIYICYYKTGKCQKKSAPPELINSGNIMPMFGYKMIYDRLRNVIVSSPLADNVIPPYSKIWKFGFDKTSSSYVLKETAIPCSFGTDLYIRNNVNLYATQETRDFACDMVHSSVLNPTTTTTSTAILSNYPGYEYGRMAVITDNQNSEYLVIPAMAENKIYPIINIISLATLTRFTTIIPSYGSNLSYSSFGFNIISEDVNDDRFKDVIIADHSYSDTLIDQGVVFVFNVSPNEKNIRNLISPRPSQVLFGPNQSYSYFGSSIASLGYVNNDRYSEIIVCAVGANENRGACYIFLGSSNGFDRNYIQEISALGSDLNYLEDVRFFGSYVLTKFDVNNDKIEDILISSARSNKVFLFLGKPTCESIFNIAQDTLILTKENVHSCLPEYTCYKIDLSYKLACESNPTDIFKTDPTFVITYHILDTGGASQLFDKENFIQNVSMKTVLKVDEENSFNTLNVVVKNSVYAKRNFLTLVQTGNFALQAQSCKSQCPSFEIMSDERKMYFDNDCEDNSNCKPQLAVNCNTNSSMLYTHVNNTIYVSATITNQGEFADEYNVTLSTFKNCTSDFIIQSTIPLSSLITKTESGTKQDNFTIYGIYNLKKDTNWNILFVINAEVRDDKDLSMMVSVGCPNCIKTANNNCKVSLRSQLKSDLQIAGKSSYAELSIPYQDDVDPSSVIIQYSYYIEISSSGPSNVDNASITIDLLSILEGRNITSFNTASDSASCSLKYPVCQTLPCAQLNATLQCFITNLERNKIYNMSIFVNLLHSFSMILHDSNSTRKLEIHAKVEHTNPMYVEIDTSQKKTSIVVLAKCYRVFVAKRIPSWIVIIVVLGCCVLILATIGLICLIKSMSSIMDKHENKC